MRRMNSISLPSSHYHSKTTDVATHPCQYFEWCCITLHESIWSGLTLPLIVCDFYQAWKIHFLQFPLQRHLVSLSPPDAVGERVEEEKKKKKKKKKLILIIKIWLTPKQRAVVVHCAFVFNFFSPKVFNHNIWHLSRGGVHDVDEKDKKNGALYVTNSYLYVLMCLCACVQTWPIACM